MLGDGHSPVVRSSKLSACKMFDTVLQNEGGCFHLLHVRKREDMGGMGREGRARGGALTELKLPWCDV